MPIRDATADDLPAILAIFNEAIRATTAVWRLVEVTREERAGWMAGRRAQGYPVLVAVEGGAVVGFGSFGDFRAGEGYAITVEHSVYVDAAARRQGHGQALVEALIAHARALGKRVMIGGVDAANAPSIRLHERLGFAVTARLPAVGRKFDRPLDLVFLQRSLDG